MVTERVAIWDFFNVKDCDFCLKLCRILNKLKKITHFLEEIYKTKKFYTFITTLEKLMTKCTRLLQNIWDEAFIQESTSRGIQMQMKTDIVKMSWN